MMKRINKFINKLSNYDEFILKAIPSGGGGVSNSAIKKRDNKADSYLKSFVIEFLTIQKARQACLEAPILHAQIAGKLGGISSA